MAHAGTMVGGSAQTKQTAPLAAIALAVAVAVATIAGIWLASSAGLVGGTAKPAAGRSDDQIEAQRGAITLSGDRSQPPMTRGSVASSTGPMQRRTSPPRSPCRATTAGS